MNSFQRWALSYALGGKSAEYVFGFMKLCDINQQYVLIRFLHMFRHTSHVSDSLFTPRLSDNIFHFRRSYFKFSLVQDTLPHCRRKIKRVRWFAGDWCPPHIPCPFTAHGIL